MNHDGPRFETRRAADFERELVARAKAWIPAWSVDEDAGDFGRAILHVAARFASEVGERLDRAGEKLRGGFFDWIGLRGEAARPARMPVVFRMVAKAPAGILARAPVSMQVDVGADTVGFETETDVRIVPGRIAQVVAVDADADAIYLPPPGLWDIEPVPAAPTQWRLKSFASGGSEKLQLDPPDGLVPGLVIALAGTQYLITAVDKDIVTIDPPLVAADGVVGATVATQVSVFAPFDAGVQNRQRHALYVGDLDLLDIDSRATIDVMGLPALQSDVKWQYWGKKKGGDGVGWQAIDGVKAGVGKVTLTKLPGSVEPVGIGPVKSSRWIRAVTSHVECGTPPVRTDALSLRVNCDDANDYPPCPGPGSVATADLLPVEAMANTTPLVVSGLFYPLGRTPKQFDAFYLACDEALSKKGAHVSLCFNVAGSSFNGFSPLTEGVFGGRVLAGIDDGGALHLYQLDPSSGAITKFRDRDPLQPPSPGFTGAASSTPAGPLDKKSWRLPAWAFAATLPFGGPSIPGLDFRIAASAGAKVWVWHEDGFNPRNSGWEDFGAVPVGASADPIDALVYLADAAARLVALRGGKLAIRNADGTGNWAAFAASKTWKCIAPIVAPRADGTLGPSLAMGLVGVASDDLLYAIRQDGTVSAQLGAQVVSSEVQPFAVGPPGAPNPGTVVAVTKTLDALVAIGVAQPMPLGAGARVTGGWLDGMVTGTLVTCVAAVTAGSGSYLGVWSPNATGALGALLQVPLDASLGTLGGAPTLVSGDVVVPGTESDAFVSPLDLSKRKQREGIPGIGIVVPAGTPALANGDVVMQLDSLGNPVLRSVAGARQALGADFFQPISASFGAGPGGGPIVGYTLPPPKAGTVLGAAAVKLQLQGANDVAVNTWILVQDIAGTHKAYHVDQLAAGVATLSPAMTDAGGNLLAANAAVHYCAPIDIGAREAPTLAFDTPDPGWDAGVLATTALLFDASGDPASQMARVLKVYAGNHPWVIVLGSPWKTVPTPNGAGKLEFVLDIPIAAGWTHQLANDVSNPKLSWEYWNGAWSVLAIHADDTLNLKESGKVQFAVPDDIAATDWAGKTHFWVRARLVGGDYGTEKVTVETTVSGSTSVQTVKRSDEGFKPPAIGSLVVLYSVCTQVTPKYVVTEDSGSFRDQSDANRTDRAIVEAFVPLCLALGRLTPPDTAAPPAQACPPDCEGPCSAMAADAQTRSDAELNPLAPATPMSGRAIFVGVDGDVSGEPVNLLCAIATEHDHDPFAPMRVSTLVGARLLPLVASDGTRALGESGIVTIAFEDAPTEAELFGQSLRWIRLAPRAAAGTWAPGIAGMYLNAAWASAQETLTRELLGSSEGAPHLVVKLARPPVLRDSLELRVCEPLGEEERAALLAQDPASVVHDDLRLPGDWVLWKQVDDPADEAAGARVYALDELAGTIAFGDGLHGRIPPVGRDNIVAFAYKRTDELAPGATDVPGNQVAARTKVNLVTPLESVEAAFSAADAAGGAPPEPPARVLNFGAAHLRNRGRVIAPADFADLALETFPDIAQARALPSGTRVRLVVVMRGAQPAPTRAQQRELARFLLECAPPTFDPAALAIRGPALRRLAIDLVLAVDSLDAAGRVSDDAKTKLAGLFDTARGGRAGTGWPLGANPTADDIALALSGIAHLDSIEGITPYEVLADGTRAAWPSALAPNELAWLAADPLRFEYLPMKAAA